jgi:hypothetical protein
VDAGAATPELLQLLTAERERVQRQISDLFTVRDHLDEVIGTATSPRQGCVAAYSH